jgi:hypothetical protein
MNTWVLGETKNVYTQVSAALGSDPIISDATYEVFDASDESVVASGSANISSLIVYFLWTPSETGVYVARIKYTVVDELYTSDQVLEVKETM